MTKLYAMATVAALSAVESFRKREEGQTMAEYGVVLAVITLLVIGALTLLSTRVRATIQGVADILPGG